MTDTLDQYPRIYCPNCDAVQIVLIDHRRPDMVDLTCAECEFVVATLYADVPR